jgi:hypothetical protein
MIRKTEVKVVLRSRKDSSENQVKQEFSEIGRQGLPSSVCTARKAEPCVCLAL